MPGVVETQVQGVHSIGEIYSVPITKGKQELRVNSGDFPVEIFAEIFYNGLKVLLNKGMGDIKTKDLEGDALAKAQAQAMKFAQDNLNKLLTGEFKKTSSKATKVAGKIVVEARRLARQWTKDQLKHAGHKPSQYKASEISKFAQAVIDSDPSWIEMAKASLEQAAAKTATIDLGALKPDPTLVAKAKEKKKDRPLSATQAGLIAPRAKPQVGSQVRH